MVKTNFNIDQLNINNNIHHNSSSMPCIFDTEWNSKLGVLFINSTITISKALVLKKNYFEKV